METFPSALARRNNLFFCSSLVAVRKLRELTNTLILECQVPKKATSSFHPSETSYAFLLCHVQGISVVWEGAGSSGATPSWQNLKSVNTF